ncbi:hypothetical protein MKSMC1_01150 [Mycobacterium kansasii]|uniref:Uncharacterized protein n=1 Tax=Mycobacterium kansasii TaxID=1768 RepID=A0A1V3WW00_MYCKA|nr:hypothetical protein MKSMC1_01150 [Mycobacterium kansasii]OOK71183.1 hypothetical protein BZL29_5751 [Mycobacterium kansasii]
MAVAASAGARGKSVNFCVGPCRLLAFWDVVTRKSIRRP